MHRRLLHSLPFIEFILESVIYCQEWQGETIHERNDGEWKDKDRKRDIKVNTKQQRRKIWHWSTEKSDS